MKYLLFFLFPLIVIFPGCRKSADKNTNTLIGKWTYTGSYYSIGGPQIWSPAQPANQVIEFKPDGTISATGSVYKTFTNYEIIDSAKVKLRPVSAPPGYLLMGYVLNAAGDKLVLYNPGCVEGCSDHFKRAGF